jgi:AICAR transformylase/IMP cyclohydrolase PurH
MPTNKKMKGGRKKKADNNQNNYHKSLKNHKENTAEMKQLALAQVNFEVQKALGRPIRKYNLLYTTDEGDYFSSEDDLKDNLIMNVLRHKQIKYGENCANWSLMYRLKSLHMKSNQQFYMYANLSSKPETRKNITIDRFSYFTWKIEE